MQGWPSEMQKRSAVVRGSTWWCVVVRGKLFSHLGRPTPNIGRGSTVSGVNSKSKIVKQ